MKCLDYCRYGRDGCKDGFSSCKLLHPVLCKSSLNHRQCYNSNCTLAHLKGTIRNLEDRRYNGQSQNHASQGNIANSAPIAGNSGMHKYKPYDPQNLGFFSYQQPSRNRRQQEPHPINQRYHQPRNDYSYDVSNFPSTQEAYTKHIPNKNDRGSMSYPNDSFLEMFQLMRSIQNTQQSFQQELLSIKTHLDLLPLQTKYHQNQLGMPLQQQQQQQKVVHTV